MSNIAEHAARLAELRRSRAASGLETADLERTLATLTLVHTGLPETDEPSPRHAAFLRLDGILADQDVAAPDVTVIQSRINAAIRAVVDGAEAAAELERLKGWTRAVPAKDVIFVFTPSDTQVPRVEAYLKWLFVSNKSRLTLAGGRTELDETLFVLGRAGQSAMLDHVLAQVGAEPRTRNWIDLTSVTAMIEGIAESDDPEARAWLFVNVDVAIYVWSRAVERAVRRNTPASLETVRAFGERFPAEFASNIDGFVKIAIDVGNAPALEWMRTAFPALFTSERMAFMLARHARRPKWSAIRWFVQHMNRQDAIRADPAPHLFAANPVLNREVVLQLIQSGYVNATLLPNRSPAYLELVRAAGGTTPTRGQAPGPP